MQLQASSYGSSTPFLVQESPAVKHGRPQTHGKAARALMSGDLSPSIKRRAEYFCHMDPPHWTPTAPTARVQIYTATVSLYSTLLQANSSGIFSRCATTLGTMISSLLPSS